MDCREKIMSEEYADFIIDIDAGYDVFLERYGNDCPVLPAVNYGIVYRPLNEIVGRGLIEYNYSEIPKLYGLMDISAIESTGAARLLNFPGLGLGGSGIIIGIIADGIDAYHEAFRYSNGNTRILAAWDQQNQSLETPYDLRYGSFISGEVINEELEKDNSEILTSLAAGSSYGTFLAGIAAGNLNYEKGFASAAPLADIVMVKLKPAKQYLREYYNIREDARAYQENDVLNAVNFLSKVAIEYGKPIIICLPLGSSQGAHSGLSIIGDLLSTLGGRTGIGICVANGNEGNSRHHYSGKLPNAGAYEDVEIRVAENLRGFTLELWGESPDFFSIEIISPTGEKIQRVAVGVAGNQLFDLLFERTRISVRYELVERKTGAEVIQIKFDEPTAGIWTIRVHGEIIANGEFNMWLPITEFIGNDTYFLKPDPYITLTIPADTSVPISVGAYDDDTGSIYIDSGRGFPTNMTVKPSFAAPGVRVFGPGTGNSYVYRSGTSISAGITAGVMAQFMEWGIIRGNSINMNTTEIKNYLIRGAQRRPNIEYPNREWGYGTLDAYNSIDILRK